MLVVVELLVRYNKKILVYKLKSTSALAKKLEQYTWEMNFLKAINSI